MAVFRQPRVDAKEGKTSIVCKDEEMNTDRVGRFVADGTWWRNMLDEDTSMSITSKEGSTGYVPKFVKRSIWIRINVLREKANSVE